MKLKYLFIAAMAVLVAGSARSQNVCGTDLNFAEQVKNDPTLLEKRRQFEEILRLLKEGKGKANADTDQIITIPVVFHVFHTNGPENITRTQIQDQIRVLNEDYNLQNADTSNTDSLFKPLAANMRIRFELAKRDQFGRCTDGVVRVYTTYTNNADDNIKKLSAWPTQKFLNIWVVKNIKDKGQAGTILGYAQFPGGSGVTDGVLIKHDYIGTVGTSNTAHAGRVATHEVGHWLGLIHPFQDGCAGGDQVEDTPPVKDANFGCIPRNSCTTDIPDLPDMIQNFMDYADGYCQNLFTKGQKQRVRNALFTNRVDLWAESNLFGTGVTDPTAQNCLLTLAPVAAAFVSNQLPCAGSSVTFRDISYNGTATSRLWEFPGGAPATSTAITPSVQYATPGKYNVKLTVTNANGEDVTTLLDYMQVAPAAATKAPPFGENMETIQMSFDNWYSNSTSPYNWYPTSLASYTGSKAVYVNNGYYLNGTVLNLYSPIFKGTSLTSHFVSFAYSYAQKTSPFIGSTSGATNDRLSVYVSVDCGTTWTPLWTRQGSGLSTVTGAITPETNFVPTGAEMWKVGSVAVPQANGKASVRLKFEFTSVGGGAVYLDDVNVNSSGALSNGADLVGKPSWALYPNPADHTVQLAGTDGREEISIADISGKIMSGYLTGSSTSGEMSIKTSGLQAGIYFVTVKSKEYTQVLKLIIAR